MSVAQAFDLTADYYDDWVKKALPCYEEAFATATELIHFDPNSPIRVLDLGAGTGLFSWHVFQAFPEAQFCLYDLSDKMMDVARSRFGSSERVSYVVDDYLNLQACGEYDLAISSLSIHHLEHHDKRLLFFKIHDALKPGGQFVNLDQIKGDTHEIRELYWSTWLSKARANGGEEDRIQASIDRRRELDRDATLTDQLTWLSESGFACVDCVYKHYFIGVFNALKSSD
jgi:tRNA (cmo5U34)-methyltransferase